MSEKAFVDSLFEYRKTKRMAQAVRERRALFGLVGILLGGVEGIHRLVPSTSPGGLE